MANHFWQFVGTDYKRMAELFPDRQFQLDWIREYLAEYHRLTGRAQPTDDQVEEMYDMVQMFALSANLLWSVWAVIQAEKSDIEFDYMNYAILAVNEFKRYKAVLKL